MIVAQCPERDSLYEYSVGGLSSEEYKEVSEHLEHCPECQAELVTLEDGGDTLVGQLRTRIDEPCLGEPGFRAAVAQARTISRRAAGERTESFAPHILGEYELLEEIGRGGMGRVYKARHTKLNRIVAVKILPRGRLEKPQSLARFEREMRAIGGLNHSHVVHAYDGREIDQMPVLVMEYVEGMDLAELVRRLGRLKPEDACELVRQVALGLQYAHENGLVHRDIKPSNIMLARDGNVKLLDLGLARSYADPLGEEVTGAGQAMGTADYIAPEQVGDSRSADIRADIYSLGCTLYKLLSGRAPYSGQEYRGAYDKMNAHLHCPLPPITQHAEGLPAGLTVVVERMLAKDPTERFATPAKVVEILSPFAAGADTAKLVEQAERSDRLDEAVVSGGDATNGGRQPDAAPQPQRRKHWRPWLVALGLVPAILATGYVAGVMLTIQKNGESSQVIVPEGAQASVDADGNVGVTLPGDADMQQPSAGDKAASGVSDEDAMQGVWRVERLTSAGKSAKISEGNEKMKAAFDRGRYMQWIPGQTPGEAELTREASYALDASADPKSITFSNPLWPKPQKGIYRIDGDRIWIALSNVAGERPAKLASEPNSPNAVLMVLSRTDESMPPVEGRE